MSRLKSLSLKSMSLSSSLNFLFRILMVVVFKQKNYINPNEADLKYNYYRACKRNILLVVSIFHADCLRCVDVKMVLDF